MPDTIPDTSTDFWHYIPSCFAMMLFTAGTHPLICGVMHTTRSYMELRRAILSAWTIYTAVTVLCAGLAYQMYGSSLQPFAMDNIGRDLQLHLQEGGAKLKVAAGVWMAIKVLVGIVPITRPLANAYARKMSWLGQDEASGPLLMLPVLLSLAAAAVFFAERIEAGNAKCGQVQRCACLQYGSVFRHILWLVLGYPRSCSLWTNDSILHWNYDVRLQSAMPVERFVARQGVRYWSHDMFEAEHQEWPHQPTAEACKHLHTKLQQRNAELVNPPVEPNLETCGP